MTPIDRDAARRALPLIGWREWVTLPGLAVATVKAKVDTGARSSTLHAWDVEVDESAGLVHFSVHPRQHDDHTTIDAVAPLVEERDVRSSNGGVERRPVVTVRAVVANRAFDMELTLTGRDEMGFRMLLGRTAIRRRFLVDPSRSFLGGGTNAAPPSVLP